MPMIRSRVEPTRLLGSTDSASNLTESINSICVNIVRQLSSLCVAATNMFDDLVADASHVSDRTKSLNDRVVRLRDMSSKLNAVSEEGTHMNTLTDCCKIEVVSNFLLLI